MRILLATGMRSHPSSVAALVAVYFAINAIK